MQHFRENESTRDTGARYDSETVRRVLGRAAEIEAQTDAARQEAEAPLTAAQVEVLGLEVGLSPGAVRRALGELQSDTAVAAETDSHLDPVPATRGTASALSAGFAYAVLVTTLFYFLTQDYPRSSPVERDWIALLFSVALIVPPVLILLRQRKHRRRRRRTTTKGHILDHSSRRARRRG